MGADKMSISFDMQLGGDVRRAAQQAGQPLSAWLAEAAAAKLRAESLAGFLDAWDAEHGAITAEELERASRSLGLPARQPPE